MLRLMMLFAVIIAISGCVSDQQAIDASCAAYQVIRPSRLDTLETKRQVLAHNTIYRKLCK